ncbi:S41 family peptidase [Hyalangium gracile]|uniref:S41 family peptidase n=1 Tax=Hyalangium gracile TaxID=394092 RepID=UPI001CC9EB14|nr:S41 family peptidase [Hyalangium gracile]
MTPCFVSRSLLLGMLVLAAVPSPALAQQRVPARPAASAPARLTTADRAAALKGIQAAIEKSYVFPELRAPIIQRLQQARQAGRYEQDDPILFAERITEDLRAASRDGHMSLSAAPGQYAAALAPPASEEGSEAFHRRRAIRFHHGLAELKLLPGNIRYLRITGFEWVRDETGAAYDGAMRFLRDGDAAIIDLRGNGGGSSAAVQYLTSHFLDEDTLLMTFLQESEPPNQSRTLSHLPAGRMKGKPLYVLIDGGVASASEEFAYHVQQFKLGELVGARTAGGANNNALLPITPGFILSISVGRPAHALSNTNWEGVGIQPTVEAPPEQALDVALSLALTRLSRERAADPVALAEYDWARIQVEARRHPPVVAPTRLKTLAGRYGEVSVTLRDNALWLTRPDRPTRRLSPLTADGLFAVDGMDFLRVRFTARSLELQWQGEPAPRVYEKG